MVLRLDLGWLLATLLVWLRVTAATVLAPVFGPTQIPASVRMVLALGISAMIVAALPVKPPQIESAVALAMASCAELVIGASLSFGFLVAYAATHVAGRVLDVQIGFGIASIIDPSTRNFAPLIGTLLGMVAVTVFLSFDGHHVLLRALALSIQQSPPGSSVHAPNWDALMKHSGTMFTFGLALAAPVMFALLLADLAMAVLARSMPLLNVFVLSFSLKVVLGIAGLAAAVKLAEPLFARLFGATYQYWEQALGAP
jgi:flagellar biosynthetic protein FliR